MFYTIVTFFLTTQQVSSYNTNHSITECNHTLKNMSVSNVVEYDKDITFEKVLDKHNVSEIFIDNLFMLIHNGYKPFKEYSEKGVCLDLDEEKYEKEMNKYSFRDENRCQMDYTYKLIKKLNIEYIPFEVLKLIIRDINRQNRYEKETRYCSKKHKRRVKKHIRLNYIEYTQTEELDYMQNICYIEYDKLDYKIIKKKYELFIKKELYNINKKYIDNGSLIKLYLFVIFIYIVMIKL